MKVSETESCLDDILKICGRDGLINDKQRQKILNRDLEQYDPKQWKANIPFKAYNFRVEDVVPALSGAIGKVSLVAAFTMAWATGLKIIDPTFVTENVRLEIVIASIFTLIFSAFLNPAVGPPGTLAPLIPIIPIMISAGVHPLPFSLLVGAIGLIIALLGYFSHVVKINGPGTKGGILLLFGVLGITSSLDKLREWTDGSHHENLLFVLLTLGVVIYLVLNKLNVRWLIIPLCAFFALLVSFFFGLTPVFKTPIALPIINPDYWWNVKWGIGYGFTVKNFLVAMPFALLVIAMWPIDALAITTMQESNYPVKARKAIFDLNATFIIISIRNMVGVILGGGQVSAVWRSFMIPLSVVKRPIGGSALILGIFGICFGIFGFLIDISTFPPLVWLVLIFGVFVPLVEIGFSTLRNMASIQIAVICLILGIGLNPVLGWSFALLVENFNIISNQECDRVVGVKEKVITAAIFTISIFSYSIIIL